MSAAFAWLGPLPLHASLDDRHGWLYRIAAIAIVGGVWVALAGVAERWGGRGRGGGARVARERYGSAATRDDVGASHG